METISEDEVIAVFLRGELDSGRYGEKLRSLLARDARDPEVLRRPDLTDRDQNSYRRQLLDEHRAFERREGLFAGFPIELVWRRTALGRDEVLDILFINWDWWLRLSGGSRRPRDAARRIRNGEIAGVTPEEHEPFASALQKDPLPPELIAVTTPERSPLVLVEGHVRLTAYALFPGFLAQELVILLGISDGIRSWCQF